MTNSNNPPPDCINLLVKSTVNNSVHIFCFRSNSILPTVWRELLEWVEDVAALCAQSNKEIIVISKIISGALDATYNVASMMDLAKFYVEFRYRNKKQTNK